MKLKHACTDAGQYGVNVSPDAYVDSGVRMLRTSDLTDDGRLSEAEGVYLEGPVPESQVLQGNDLLLSRAGTIGRAYLVPPQAAGDTFAGFLVRFRPDNSTDPRFLLYALRSKIVQDQIRADAVSSTIQNFNADRYANLKIPDTPPAQQRRIADFLDDRVARLDQIRSARRKQIDRLWEAFGSRVTTVIDETGGQRCPLWLMAQRITDGAHVSPETDAGVYDFVSTRDLDANGVIDFDGALKTSAESYAALVRQGCRPIAGDVLFSKDGTVGRTARINESLDFVVASSLIIIRPIPRLLDFNYLHYLFKHAEVVHQVDAYVKGAGLPRISIANLRRVVGIFPPLGSQASVAQRLENEFARTSDLVRALNDTLGLLTEYRRSLITDAVAGAIDVTTAGSGVPG